MRFTKFCWVRTNMCIITKPSKSPTQGQPNSRKKKGLTVASGPHFFPEQLFFLRVGIVFFLWETDYKKPNPINFSANTPKNSVTRQRLLDPMHTNTTLSRTYVATNLVCAHCSIERQVMLISCCTKERPGALSRGSKVFSLPSRDRGHNKHRHPLAYASSPSSHEPRCCSTPWDCVRTRLVCILCLYSLSRNRFAGVPQTEGLVKIKL